MNMMGVKIISFSDRASRRIYLMSVHRRSRRDYYEAFHPRDDGLDDLLYVPYCVTIMDWSGVPSHVHAKADFPDCQNID